MWLHYWSWNDWSHNSIHKTLFVPGGWGGGIKIEITDLSTNRKHYTRWFWLWINKQKQTFYSCSFWNVMILCFPLSVTDGCTKQAIWLNSIYYRYCNNHSLNIGKYINSSSILRNLYWHFFYFMLLFISATQLDYTPQQTHSKITWWAHKNTVHWCHNSKMLSPADSGILGTIPIAILRGRKMSSINISTHIPLYKEYKHKNTFLFQWSIKWGYQTLAKTRM